MTTLGSGRLRRNKAPNSTVPIGTKNEIQEDRNDPYFRRIWK